MRILVTVVILAGLGGLYLWQKKTETRQAPATSVATQRAAPSPAAAAAMTTREPSEHNWMKRSLDRAHNVTEQARARTRDSQDP
jgi:hypothetical protein